MGNPALQAPAHRKRKDELLAAITSPDPTRYKLIATGSHEPIHVYCALDTLEYAWITGQSYRVIADPPAGEAMQFRLTLSGPGPAPGSMSSVIPERIAQLPAAKGMPSRCCPYIHFFASQTAYETWHRSLPATIRQHIQYLSLNKAWQKARCVLEACKTTPRCDC